MSRDYKLYVKDIFDCIEKIEGFIRGMSFDEFVKDDKTNSAVVRKLEIIGEAVKNIPNSISEKDEDIPWKDMAKMRDKIIHFYFGVDYEIVWKVIKKRLPEIKLRIERILEDLVRDE
ncbi:MAG: DUF86 domain-containing protein [Candidatus Omnitrophota bacterium]|nr:DUF86 domain-containing protein [Candidatus Omnitrophota bacterium]